MRPFRQKSSRFLTHAPDVESSVRVVAQIGQVLSLLKRFPHIGHDGHRPGTFEMLVPRLPVVIVYRIDVGDGEELIVLRVYHTRQQRSAAA